MEQKERYLALRLAMMPRDTNPYGVIFGGVILSCIDQAGHAGAKEFIVEQGWVDRPLVTVLMHQVEFHQPVLVGDIVSLYSQVVRLGRSSVLVHVDVEVTREGTPVKVTEADVTYVAVEIDGNTRCSVSIRPEE